LNPCPLSVELLVNGSIRSAYGVRRLGLKFEAQS